MSSQAQTKKSFRKRYMMATKATHLLGDISREHEHICFIREEDEENFIGHWVTGFGFEHVKFPKATTRELTADEKVYYRASYIQINEGSPIPYNPEFLK